MRSGINNIAVIGAAGALGKAFVTLLSSRYPAATLTAFSRTDHHHIDYSNEESLAAAAALAAQQQPLDLVIVTNGILHTDEIMPEKALRDLSAEKFHHLLEVNLVTPALLAKHFLPHMNRDRISRFAVLSARVGSISDNRLGGWYAYRASKAALNMVIKNAAIETNRRNPQAIVVGLHPGTVDSPLSKPFQAGVPEGKLFTPEYSADRLLRVLEHLSPEDSGSIFAWDGQEIMP